jgi:hypothetical protein
MDYKKIYDSLIFRGKNRQLDDCYYEKHHIIPRCMGGDDSIDNLVKLTPEEHYLAHQLLVKIYPDNYSLVLAASMMIPNRPSNKLYGWLKRRFAKSQSILQSGKGNSQYNTFWITDKVNDRKCQGEIPNGWFIGRASKYQTQLKKEQIVEQRLFKKEILLNQKIEYLRQLYYIYSEFGFNAVKQSGYKYSKQNLVSHFAKHLPEFIPQNGKKRSK